MRRILQSALAVLFFASGVMLVFNGVPTEVSESQLWGYHLLAIGACWWLAWAAAREALKP